MLTFRIVHFPKKPSEFKYYLNRIAELLFAYWKEIETSEFLFDVQVFAQEWMEGEQHVLGYFDGDDLVGLALAKSGNVKFSDEKMMVYQNIFILEEFRTADNLTMIYDSLKLGREYGEDLGFKNFFVEASPEHEAFFKKMGGKVVYIGLSL